MCSKKGGGLGLKRVDVMNQAFILKLAWEYLTRPTTPWAWILYNKYGKRETQSNALFVSRGDSFVWKQLAQVWPTLHNHLAKNLGSRNQTSF